MPLLLQVNQLPIWIVPSVHHMPNGFVLPSSIGDLIEGVDQVAFERDLDASFHPTCESPRVIDALDELTLDAAKRIWTAPPFEADPNVLYQLTLFQATQEIDRATTQYMRGYSFDNGIDRQLWALSPSEKRTWLQSDVELERMMMTFPVPEQVEELRYVCDLPRAGADLDSLRDAWLAGDSETIAQQSREMYERTPVNRPAFRGGPLV